MVEQVYFANVSIVLPAGWYDVTGDLDEDAPPTLGREKDAYGALQFTMAHYEKGEQPAFSVSILKDLLNDFEQNRIHQKAEVYSDEIVSENYIVSGEYILDDEFLKVWYLSDGLNLAFVTYTTLEIEQDFRGELAEAGEIVKSIRF